MALENLDALLEDLKLDGLSNIQIDEVLEALRAVYIGQEKSDSIGIPKVDIEDLYRTKLGILNQKDLVYTVPHTGAWDYGYRCTENGTAIGSELMKKYLEENGEDIRRYLDRYPKKLLSWWIDSAFNKTDTGHLTSHIAQLSFKHVVQEMIKALDILEICEKIRRKLVTFGVAMETYGKEITVLPPEFAAFMVEYTASASLKEETNTYGVFRTLRDFADRRITQKDDLVETLSKYGYNEGELIKLLKEMSELGLTTQYVDYSIEENIDKEPFEVLDYQGYLGYIEERFAVPFKESLMEGVA